MRLHHEHPWNLEPKHAIALQNQLREFVITKDDLPAEIKSVAGVDVGFESNGTVTRAAVVVLRLPDLHVIDRAVAKIPTGFPYIPGLLSFREIPAILKALAKLDSLPDLLLCDGQGYAHPRRFGIACHLGLLTNIPSLGVGKTRLIGEHPIVPDRRGAWVPLTHQGEGIGAVLRSRVGVKPVYISSGHRISLETSLHYVMQCTTRFKLPETTRQAHRLASPGGFSVAGSLFRGQHS
ncbi:MAG: deoxyribonuclease V [Methylococcales bacterium]